jgi:transcriptional regulator with XRE-family HTH domain
MSEEFGQRVAEARKEAGLTQTQLGNRLGRTRSTVANIEAGRQNPGVDLVLRIAQVLSVPAGWLMNDEVVDPGVSRRRATYLSPPDLRRLDWACRPIVDAFGSPPYLVGSTLTRPDYRDIDLRLILPDERVAALDGGEPKVRLLLNVVLSDFVARAANLPVPVDFQIQSMSEANVPKHGARNPMGVR